MASLFSFLWLRLIRQQKGEQPTISSLIKAFIEIPNHELCFEGIRLLMTYGQLSNVEMVVATELLLGGDNTSIDLDFCFILALAEEFGSLLLKKLVTIIHNGQNNKVTSVSAIQAVSIIVNLQFDESEWHRICTQFVPSSTRKIKKAIFTKVDSPMTMDAEVWSDEDIHADVSALNDIFGGDSVSMNYVGDWCHLVPPILEPSFNEWKFLDGQETGQALVWDMIYREGGKLDTEVYELMKAASIRILSASEVSLIASKVINDPTIISRFDLSKEKLTLLISWNWSLVVELVCLSSTNGVHDNILDTIVELDITVQVVEVVYGVARKLVLPKRFIKNFLSRSIIQCAQTDDLIAQNRTVQALCALVHLFIKHSPDKIMPLLAELLSFCVTYSHIHDCTVLYKSIKEIEGELIA